MSDSVDSNKRSSFVSSDAAPDFGKSKNASRLTPPSGYVCAACGVPGHWVYNCSKKAVRAAPPAGSPQLRLSRPGEPTAEHIRLANEMMPVLSGLVVPNCFCGLKAAARKNQKKDSPGYGFMFWWCNKPKGDETRCKLARRVSEEAPVPTKDVRARQQLAGERGAGGLEGGESREVEDVVVKKAHNICAFFLKNGSCKKGEACKFTHARPGETIVVKKKRTKEEDESCEVVAVKDEENGKEEASEEGEKEEKKKNKRKKDDGHVAEA